MVLPLQLSGIHSLSTSQHKTLSQPENFLPALKHCIHFFYNMETYSSLTIPILPNCNKQNNSPSPSNLLLIYLTWLKGDCRCGQINYLEMGRLSWIILIQFSSVAQSHQTLCNPTDCSTPGFPVHHQLLDLAQTHVHRVGDAVQPHHPVILFSSSLQSFPASGSFSNESVPSIRWSKYWSFSFSIGPSNEYPGLISFTIDWFDLLEVQGTLKSLLQHQGSKASILQSSTFFRIQLSHPNMTTGKTIALTRWTFVSKVMSLLFNMLSMLVIAFLSWL